MAAPAQANQEQEGPIEALIRAGLHREAAAACAHTHGASIGRLCMAMLGGQAEAEEALQDTLLAAHDAMASYRGEGSVRAWLFGIARRVCARRLESRTRQSERLHLLHDADADAALPDEVIDARRRAHTIRAALATLPPSEREALLLHYQADLSYREIGCACGIDEAAARKRASRGLEKLRVHLQREDPR